MNISTLNITKPFPNYKWRWMELTPVESFNRPDIILGVTRAISQNEGRQASSEDFLSELAKIQSDLLSGTGINIIPTDPSRNVIRRQGRYWRGLGLLAPAKTRGMLLTPMGKKLASGLMTSDQFVAQTVMKHTLPNRLIDSKAVVAQWQKHSLTIQPLSLILTILLELKNSGDDAAHITSEELFKVVIPLSILDAELTKLDYCDAILGYRRSPGSFSHFPDCVPEANDKRMAREHLLFLANYELLDLLDPTGQGVHQQQFALNEAGQVLAMLCIEHEVSKASNGKKTVDISIQDQVDINLGAVRRKRLAAITERPNQTKFRRLILDNFNSRCLLTGESTVEALDACHIISVRDGGMDSIDNGLCMRTDLHRLYDVGKLRIGESGTVDVSPDMSSSATYKSLPKAICLPGNVSRDYLRRRCSYGRTNAG